MMTIGFAVVVAVGLLVLLGLVVRGEIRDRHWNKTTEHPHVQPGHDIVTFDCNRGCRTTCEFVRGETGDLIHMIVLETNCPVYRDYQKQVRRDLPNATVRRR